MIVQQYHNAVSHGKSDSSEMGCLKDGLAFIYSFTTRAMPTLFNSLPEEDAEVDSVISFELEEMVQNTGTLCKLKRTFSGKHQLRPQHLEVDQEGIPRDRIPAPDPTSMTSKNRYWVT